MPPALTRAALSRGVQHSNAIVRHATLCLLCHVLSRLQSFLADLSAALKMVDVQEQKGGDHSRQSAVQQWRTLAQHGQLAARAFLPDVQPVLAQLSSIEKDVKASVAEESERGEGNGASTLLLSATLGALCRWQRCLPAALLEANVDAEKLVPVDLVSLQPLHQLQFLNLLEASQRPAFHPESAASRVTKRRLAGVSPALLPVLTVLSSSGLGDVHSTASAWAASCLRATGLFEDSMADEVFIWLDSLPRYAPEFLI